MLKIEYNSGDNVHLNDAGYLAIGNYILTNIYCKTIVYNYSEVFSAGYF